MRVSRVAVVCGLLAVAAAGGGAYVVTRPATSTSQPPAAAAKPRPPILSALPDTAATTGVDVAARLRRAVAASAFGGSLAGVVVDAVTGRTLFARTPDRPLPPASTVKLLTAVAALDSLGAAETLHTGVVRAGRTLYLVGGGDVTLTARAEPGYPPTATLSALARATAAALATTPFAAGPVRLRYDVSAWTGRDEAPGWNSGYFSAGDVSHLTPLEVDEGRVDHGEPLRVADPAESAAQLFADALERRGVDVRDSIRAAGAPPSALGIAAVDSPPVGALVERMLTVSDNDLAESLGRELAERAGLPATFRGAARAVMAGLDAAGVPVTGVRLHDASGLSHLDRVPPRTLVAALRAALTGDTRLAPAAWGLPVAGLTGTLADRYRHGPARVAAGVLRAKTGTLAGVSTLAGQVVDARGDLLVFAFMTDRAALPGPAEAALDRLAARLVG